ncbi:hypothetical protein E4S40_15480 [Algoriphagus kandeliae]|uniref:histidine kinase n=1 Tax=Algoriphagus kandeliae TaxID=2562278 RepID=A0A4Y9QRJ3_9BACT|nr:ATP-binding protein [Algoriphagus kandeliae]TFV93643.1 hypothetical protein E4S40_15480 [Algoriphagus kandeliae]
MKEDMQSFGLRVFLLFSLALAVACQSDENVPIPENPSNFQIPTPVPFEIPEGKTIEWKTIQKDSVPKGRKMSFNWDRLPSKPFSLEEEEPLKKPLDEISFDWEELEEAPLTLEIEFDSLQSVKFPLPAPIVSLVGTPLKAEGSAAGILNLSNGQGLPGNTIYAQTIAPDGSHWIGTEQGLVKFAGNEFHLYEIVTTEFASGVINIISDLDFDQEGRLIVSTFERGFLIVDLENEIVEKFKLPYGFTRGTIDRDGNYWGGRISGLLKFVDLKNRTLSRINLESKNLNIINGFGSFVDSKNNLWLGLNSGIAIANPDRTKVKFLGRDEGISVPNIYDFREGSDGSVWLASYSLGAVNVSLENQVISRMGEEQGFTGNLIDITLDQEGNIWMGSDESFSIYNPTKGTLKTIKTNFHLRGAGPPAVSLIDEKDGMYWAGTFTNGLILYDPLGMDSRHLNTENGLVSNEVWGIEEDQNHRVWLASYGGLNIYDPSTKTLKYLEIPREIGPNDHRGVSKLSEDILFIGSLGGFSLLNLKENTITSYQGNSETARFFWRARLRKDGTLWLATNDGLIVFDQNEGTMKKVDGFTGLAGSTVWGIEEDHLNKIWVVTNSGINFIDPEKNTVSFLGIYEGLSTVDQSVIFRDSEDQMIIGGGRGISIINKERNQITNVNSDHGLEPESLYDLVVSKGRIQLGTSDGIVIIEQPSEDNPNQPWRFLNYGRAEGSPFTDYNQMTAKVTRSGKVWWAASPILTVNLQDPKLNTDAPAIVELTGIRIMDQTANLFKNSQQGRDISVFDSLTADIGNASNYLNENKITWDSLDPKTKVPLGLVLPYNQNSLTFTFSNPTIRSRDEIAYRYVLEGSDKDWSDITKNPISKTYFNLLPGDYTFKVISKGFNGVWSEPASFSFTINPPWWFTWWAFLIYAALLGLVIYTVVQIRSYYLKKENRLLEERVNHRTAQLNQSLENLKSTQQQLIQSEKMASLGELTAGIAHEIQNPLNFVNNFSEISNELIEEMKEELAAGNANVAIEIADDLKENLSKINHHGKRAGTIVKGMLAHSRSNSGERTLTDLNALADEYIRLSYHGLRAKDKSFNSNFKLELDPDLPKAKVAAQDIGRVLLNLINNAFYVVDEKAKSGIEGYKPEVIVSTKKTERGIEISVKDNGNGIPDSIKEKIFQPFFTTKPTGSGTGLGLSLSYDIVKAHGGEIKIRSIEGEGSQFIINLPIH